MDQKLTLKLDGQVIDEAKAYAREKNISLSALIEAYLENLTSRDKRIRGEVTPLVKSLSGILDPTGLPDYKESYKKYLIKKYSKQGG